MNPALTLPNQQAFREGLLRDDVFTAVHDPHWTETCDYADSVLPAQSFLEKEDVIVPWSHGYVRKSERVMDPLAESRHEIRVMQDLAQRLGLEAPGLYEDPWAVLEKAFEGAVQEPGTFQGILNGHRTKLKYRPRDQYQTPSGKMEFYSQAAEARGHSPLPLFVPNDLGEGRFLLIGSAVPEYTHTQFQDVYGPIPASVTIHPNDALASGIQEGEAVVLLNDLGQTTVRATISDAVPQGALWCPRQFTGTDGNPHNILTSGRTQPIGNGSILNSTVVRMRKA
jgi:anaerobic selenocysteine-containing dehydrogenase